MLIYREGVFKIFDKFIGKYAVIVFKLKIGEDIFFCGVGSRFGGKLSGGHFYVFVANIYFIVHEIPGRGSSWLQSQPSG